MTTWRDAGIPGVPDLPSGRPVTSGTPARAQCSRTARGDQNALPGLLGSATEHEGSGAVALSPRLRWWIAVTIVLDLATAIILPLWVGRWEPSLPADLVTWGGHLELVAGIAGISAVLLAVLAAFSEWLRAVTGPQLWAVYAGLAASAATTGVAVVVGLIAAAIMILFGWLIAAAIWALVTGE